MEGGGGGGGRGERGERREACMGAKSHQKTGRSYWMIRRADRKHIWTRKEKKEIIIKKKRNNIFFAFFFFWTNSGSERGLK